MSDDSPAPADARPYNIDLYCIQCGYNLRGLAGDPVRCPECFFANPLGDVELPAALISAQLRRMESGPTYCVAAVLASVASIGMIWAVRAWCCAIPILAGFLAWPIAAVRFRASCMGKAGWFAALLWYHYYGLLLIALPIGIPLALLFGGERILAQFGQYQSQAKALGTMLAVIGWISLGGLWARWAYSKAIEKIRPLQREVAVSIARDRAHKRLARAPTRDLFGWLTGGD